MYPLSVPGAPPSLLNLVQARLHKSSLPCTPMPVCHSRREGHPESPNLGAIYSCGQSKPLNIPSFLLLSTKPNLSLQDIPVTQRRVKQVTPRPSFLF